MTTFETAVLTVPNHLLTRREAAAFLAISQRKLDQLTASGALPRVRIGSCVRFDVIDLQSFANSQKVGGHSA